MIFGGECRVQFMRNAALVQGPRMAGVGCGGDSGRLTVATCGGDVPFKANAAGRHHIPQQRFRITNWPKYDAALRGRGSLTVWFSAAAIAAWLAEPRTTRGGQPRYSALAIATALTLRAVFLLAHARRKA